MGKKGDWLQKGEEGDGRAEGPSAIEDQQQAAVSLTSDTDGTRVCIFESSQLERSYVGDLLYILS